VHEAGVLAGEPDPDSGRLTVASLAAQQTESTRPGIQRACYVAKPPQAATQTVQGVSRCLPSPGSLEGIPRFSPLSSGKRGPPPSQRTLAVHVPMMDPKAEHA